jgi:cytochrome c biogenesis protein CcdA/thiol-disulfide isomerase/thioredoxin
VLLLIALGFLAGVATALSPCVLPVLPILLAGGASGRKPLRIIAGLIVSFSFFTLFATWILGKLGLPGDLLRNLAIAFLFLMAAVLLVPQFALFLERGLASFTRLRPANAGGGYLLGISLGLVFVPCAGPFLGAITAAAANENFGVSTIAATLAYAIGAGVPMLLIAFGGRGAATRIRERAAQVRIASGVLVAAVAVALVFHAEDHLTTLHIPGLTGLENRIAGSSAGQKQLAKIRGGRAELSVVHTNKGGLPDYGNAPTLKPDGVWINSAPFTLASLHGKVVLIDFWTYSCINCLRTLPHLESWYARYHDKGLVIVGVHTPEFAFEHVASNVRAAVKRLGIKYPVVQDNSYKTWDNYANQYWPAEYLIDKTGRIRHTHFGEGEYDQTESLIRQLLGTSGARSRPEPDTTPTGLLTPETYLGYARLANYVGSTISPDLQANYLLPASLPQNTLAYGGEWRVGSERIVAGRNASLRLHFHAKDVYIVLGGSGTVHELVDGRPSGVLHVDAQRLYTVRASNKTADATLELKFSPGIQGYSFTFG